jgi:hypothetical protein
LVFGQNRNRGKQAPFTLKGEPLSHYQTCLETSVVANHVVLENMSQFSDYVYSRLYSGKEVICHEEVREHLTLLQFSPPTATIPMTQLSQSIEHLSWCFLSFSGAILICNHSPSSLIAANYYPPLLH